MSFTTILTRPNPAAATDPRADDFLEVEVEVDFTTYPPEPSVGLFCTQVRDFDVTLASDGSPVELTPEESSAIWEACADHANGRC